MEGKVGVQSATIATQESDRGKILELLQGKYKSVTDIPKEVISIFPFIDKELAFEVDGAKIAFLVERELRTPRWVAFVEKHAEVLEKSNFEIGIVSMCEPSHLFLPKHKDIHSAFSTSHFGLYLVRDDQLLCVYHRNLASKWAKMSVSETKPLIERLEKYKHIPNAVTKSVSNLKNGFLADPLRDIAVEYEATEFKDPREEYDFVQNAMSEILELNEFSDLKETLNFLRFIENELRTKGKRDHFLHSFQVFLLGECIIDTHTAAFCTDFPADRSQMLTLERSWLLASLMHDIGLPFQNIEWIDGVVDLEYNLLDDKRNQHSIADLSTCFSKVKGHGFEDKISRILTDHASQKSRKGQSAVNHGLISAIELLRKTMTTPKPMYENEVLPAALAIAFHDKQMWYDLVKGALVPISVKDFPAMCLLILCDNLEGWGRPGWKTDPLGKDILLQNLSLKSGNIEAKMWFQNISDALLSRWEMQEILNTVISTKDFFSVAVDQILPN